MGEGPDLPGAGTSPWVLGLNSLNSSEPSDRGGQDVGEENKRNEKEKRTGRGGGFGANSTSFSPLPCALLPSQL